MSECKDAQCREEQMHRIYEYLDGALSAEDIAEIRAHLEECETCSREYDLERLIRSAVRRSCAEPAPEALKESILAKIDAVRASPQTADHGH
ncbi:MULTISPECIES: mycothiol system anti-sigma-R factor [Rothia]|uniref:Mycothiol system anti-sigma-R factor n=1 Tax=Rothia kristinae TaxID=37923 RepID=A0A147E7A9_9MICC|nr:mycothiol system anti-sigma-R factor [Rothia kristinae]MDN5641271.1 mycothiol system anti-sigma-R factor [Actinomycetes bacterium]KTR37758.1 anti-sigma factor [Rothia kristinae]KTR60161.1 anti-sigma factor [Rothia kristinae]KTR74508.1 anti-sigma factor [Rothia kristinae]KTR78912.1 anti-sigma factor [Rothia kristinae]